MTQSDFATAYETGYASTVRFLLSQGVPSDRAEDIAQAGWTRGWERRNQLRESSKIGSWINRISLNLFRNRLRRQRSTEQVNEPPCRPGINTTTIDVRRGLDECTPKERELLRAYYLEGYTSSELGHRERCSPGAIRVRALRIKRRFLDLLQR